MSVYAYGLHEMDFDGKFVFNESECMRLTGIGRTMVYDGLRGLISRDFIRKDKRGVYWVNPNIAFRGSRDELLDLSSSVQ